MSYAPIILFVYNRPDHTRRTLEALAANTLAQESDLFVYADGAKENATGEQLEKIRETREVARSKNWCRNVTVVESEKNKGLASSIISGVTEVAGRYGKVIVLEDDIVTGKYFLDYMNTALDKYEDEKKVWHIAGWRDPVKNAKEGRSYFYPTMDCWGWATWADRWQHFKKDTSYYQSVFTDEMKFRFNIEGTYGNWSQIEANASGEINTWAIFWYATLFLQDGLCLAPTKSLVRNIGLDGSGEHCGENPKLTITDSIDFKVEFFPDECLIDQTEYEKNVRFFKDMNRISLWRKIVDFAKRVVKKPLRPVWHAAKKLYRKFSGGGYKDGLKIRPAELRTIGSGYGSYVISDSVPPDAVVFSFGIGEDTQFEEGMMDSYPGCAVYAFDPTPRSVEYVKPLSAKKQFHFLPVGLSDKNETETFYMPMNEAYVSCSVVKHEDVGRAELQVEMNDLKTLMAKCTVSRIDILKMDIEGSEFKVLPNICADRILPGQICIEFHERFFDKPAKKFKEAFQLLKKNGYELVYMSDSKEEFTFVREKL